MAMSNHELEGWMAVIVAIAFICAVAAVNIVNRLNPVPPRTVIVHCVELRGEPNPLTQCDKTIPGRVPNPVSDK